MKITTEIIDVGGRYAKLFVNAPKVVRRELGQAVAKATERVADEMFDRAPARSDDPPHVKDAIDYVSRGLNGRAGILDGGASAGKGDATMGEVALYNEFEPNEQPFARPGADAAAQPFADLATKALERAERSLAGGLGI